MRQEPLWLLPQEECLLGLLSTFLGSLKVLLLSLSTVCIKDGCTTLNGYAVNGVIFVDRDVNALCNGFLSARNNDGNRLKEGVAESASL